VTDAQLASELDLDALGFVFALKGMLVLLSTPYLYGGGSAERVWLHAATLSLAHPLDGRRMLVDAPGDSPAGQQTE